MKKHLFSRGTNHPARRLIGVGLVAVTTATAGAWADSVARAWDEQLLDGIRLDKPRPPVHARNLYHVSAAMYDAWAAYDPTADQVFHHERATPPPGMTVSQARNEAISYAAYRLITERYQFAFGGATTLSRLDAQMAQLGYDAAFTDTTGDSPAALGNRIFQTIRNACLADGANEEENYAATNGYRPVNPPLILAFAGTTMNDPNRWQPLAFSYFINQNGIPEGAITQVFICPHWDDVTPFALRRPAPGQLFIDPGPPPQLSGATDAMYKSDFEQVVEFSSKLDPTEGVMIDISPGAIHNNTLGLNDGTGYPVNPYTGQPYAPNVVNRADYGRVLAEFWADGPDSETPPGHWNVLANDVSDDPRTVKRIGGRGPIVDDLEWDVKLYLALNGAEHDAAIAAWGIKDRYDSVRPISAIRYMAQRGQSSDAGQPAYDPQGLPLIPGLVELVTNESIQPGQRHANIPERDEQGNITNSHVGEVAVRAWLGQPTDPDTQIGGVGWQLGKAWGTYQKTTFVTPPFSGYISGHSTFSRAGAEVLAGFTGSKFFPGGLATYTIPQGWLSFEYGPTQNITLDWATYYDAADEAGISRLWGGIHIASDDRTGRIAGSQVGKTSWALAQRYYRGNVACPGDWNGVGGVTLQDLFDFLTDYFSGNADTNLDGQTGTPDIFEFLTAWFGGCG